MKSRTSTQNSNKGFTLLELSVTSVVASTVLLASLGLVNEQRAQFLRDQARIQASQNLRATMDIIGTDIKQAGERLVEKPELPVISVIDGVGNAPDTLVVQRRLLALDLSVCDDVGGADITVTVAIDAADDDNDCAFEDLGPDLDGDLDTPDPDAFTDNLNDFQNYRCEQDDVDGCGRDAAPNAGNCDQECVGAYIYDPIDDEGEFFLYSFEDNDDSGGTNVNRIYRGDDGSWQYIYEADHEPRIYILEERRYSLGADGVLSLTINRQDATGQPLRLVSQLEDFQIQIETTNDLNPLTSFNPTYLTPRSGEDFPAWDAWREIRNIQVNLQAAQDADSLIQTPVERRQLTSEFFPRNVLSIVD